MMEKFSDKSFDFVMSMKSDLEEVFQSLIDHGFELKLSTYYTNKDFSRLSSRILNRVDFYYYGFEIELERSGLSGGESHQWNGSLYYEEGISLIEDIHNSIGRFKNEYPEYKIYYNIRNTNQLNIRVIMGKKENKEIIYNFEKLRSLILNIPELIKMDGYEIKHSSSIDDMELSFQIFITKDGYEVLKSNAIKSKEKKISNKTDYLKIFDSILDPISKFFGSDPNVKPRIFKDDSFLQRAFFSHVDDKGVAYNIVDMRMVIDEPTMSIVAASFISKKFIELHRFANLVFTIR